MMVYTHYIYSLFVYLAMRLVVNVLEKYWRQPSRPLPPFAPLMLSAFAI